MRIPNPLAKDPTSSLQTLLQKLSELFQSSAFKVVSVGSSATETFVLPSVVYNEYASAIYGFAKVRKPGVSLKPIVDFTRSPLYQLSRYLHKLLIPLARRTTTNIANSADFEEKVYGTWLRANTRIRCLST